MSDSDDKGWKINPARDVPWRDGRTDEEQTHKQTNRQANNGAGGTVTLKSPREGTRIAVKMTKYLSII